MSVCLSVCMSVCLHIYLSVFLYFCLYACRSVCLSSLNMAMHDTVVWQEHESSINNVLVVHERHLVLSSETNGVIKLWQAENGETSMTLFGHVQWLCISPNSQFAVSGSGAQR